MAMLNEKMVDCNDLTVLPHYLIGEQRKSSPFMAEQFRLVNWN